MRKIVMAQWVLRPTNSMAPPLLSPPSWLLLLLLLLLSHLPWLPATSQPSLDLKPTDTDSLAIFRYRADVHGILAVNWSTSDACAGRWRGVGCSAGRVTSLYLPSLDLRGTLDPLSHLDQLRLIDLHGNRLNGTLFALLALHNLKLLYLSGNDISGEIPVAIGRLIRLTRLDLSDNNFDGPIPGEGFANLTRLLTLRLNNNLFSGQLPDLAATLPRLIQLNVSNNQLSGRVPDGVRTKFGVKAVEGNARLCGPTPPLPLCSIIPRDSSPSISSPSSQSMDPSNPSSVPRSPATASTTGGAGAAGEEERKVREGLSTGAIVGIALGNIAFFLLLVLLSAYCYCAGQFGEKDGKVDAEDEQREDNRRSSDVSFFKDDCEKRNNGGKKKKKKKAARSSGESDDGSATEMRSQLVFFYGTEGDEEPRHDGDSRRTKKKKTSSRREKKRGKRFELDDLLRASAEMVGKGSIGTVYRAALDDGEMVAVKRLKDANPCARKDFNKYMDLIGRLSHPNIVPLRAYYYAKQEKLLIYDYLPNGTLFSLLHGNRGTGRTPVDWAMRVRLVLGGARGLARIHEEHRSSKIPHGNIKSSNILLDKNGAACVSDFGLALLLNPAHATTRLGGYAAREHGETRRLSQEADVYAFGVLLLEVLTGRAPNQLHFPDASISNGKAEGGMGDGGGGGMSLNLPEWVRSVVREEWTAEVFDAELLRCKNIEGEMVAMLHVALGCVDPKPDNRPTMSEVVRMIHDIRVDQSPITDDDDDEVNESRSNSLSPSLPTTATDDGRHSRALTE